MDVWCVLVDGGWRSDGCVRVGGGRGTVWVVVVGVVQSDNTQTCTSDTISHAVSQCKSNLPAATKHHQ